MSTALQHHVRAQQVGEAGACRLLHEGGRKAPLPFGGRGRLLQAPAGFVGCGAGSGAQSQLTESANALVYQLLLCAACRTWRAYAERQHELHSLLQSCGMRLMHFGTAKCFAAWRAAAERRAEGRHRVAASLARLMHNMLARSFITWQERTQRKIERSTKVWGLQGLPASDLRQPTWLGKAVGLLALLLSAPAGWQSRCCCPVLGDAAAEVVVGTGLHCCAAAWNDSDVTLFAALASSGPCRCSRV